MRQAEQNLSKEKSLMYLLYLLAGDKNFRQVLKEKRGNQSMYKIVHDYIEQHPIKNS